MAQSRACESCPRGLEALDLPITAIAQDRPLTRGTQAYARAGGRFAAQ